MVRTAQCLELGPDLEPGTRLAADLEPGTRLAADLEPGTRLAADLKVLLGHCSAIGAVHL